MVYLKALYLSTFISHLRADTGLDIMVSIFIVTLIIFKTILQMQTKLKSCWLALDRRAPPSMTFSLISMSRLGPQQLCKIWVCCLTLRYALIPHIVQIVKSCFYQLRNIIRIRPLLHFGDAETITQAFITCRLEYCNSLYSGLPAKVINRLQMVQNVAAQA